MLTISSFFAVDRVQYFETGEAQVFHRIFIMLDAAKIKVIRIIFNLTHAACRHFVNGDRRVEVHALMIKL